MKVHLPFLKLENLSVSTQNTFGWVCIINFIFTPLGVEAHLPLQEDINNGITFPMNISDIPVQSEIPSSVISMHKLCAHM